MAAVCGVLWAGTIVLYAGDNLNVQRWLETRRSRSPFARYLLMVLSCLETVYGFVVRSVYLRTYHNTTADNITRWKKSEIEKIAKLYGLNELSVREQWQSFVQRGWMRRAFTWNGQPDGDKRIALQLAEKTDLKRIRGLEAPLPGLNVTVVELWPGLGAYARACLLYTSPSPRDRTRSRMPSSA